MPTYEATVTVEQTWVIEIEADSDEDAQEIAHSTYYNGVVVDETIEGIETEEVAE